MIAWGVRPESRLDLWRRELDNFGRGQVKVLVTGAKFKSKN
jgi:hypothetical protein